MHAEGSLLQGMCRLPFRIWICHIQKGKASFACSSTMALKPKRHLSSNECPHMDRIHACHYLVISDIATPTHHPHRPVTWDLRRKAVRSSTITVELNAILLQGTFFITDRHPNDSMPSTNTKPSESLGRDLNPSLVEEERPHETPTTDVLARKRRWVLRVACGSAIYAIASTTLGFKYFGCANITV